MFSSIDIFDVFPLSTFYHRLNWRVLVNGSSSPWVSLVHDSNADGDVWASRGGTDSWMAPLSYSGFFLVDCRVTLSEARLTI